MYAVYWTNGCKDIVDLVTIRKVAEQFGSFLKTIYYNGTRIDVYVNADVHFLKDTLGQGT